ncbi:MAG: hypothetical protein MZU91_00480 [Desulfosudis oleivorans]|nr:hypothetical protein [Desulfosudis oleivorans]
MAKVPKADETRHQITVCPSPDGVDGYPRRVQARACGATRAKAKNLKALELPNRTGLVARR